MAADKPKLMLVENDPYFIYLLRLYAEQSGFAVVSTNSSVGALSMAQQERPAVIVLESDLPEITGWELLRSLRSEPLTEDTPIVVCLWRDSQQRDGIVCQCDVMAREALLHKPMQYEDFVVALKGIGAWPEGRPEWPNRVFA